MKVVKYGIRSYKISREVWNSSLSLIVVALGDQYSNYRKFVKKDSIAHEVVPLTHSAMYRYWQNQSIDRYLNIKKHADYQHRGIDIFQQHL